MEKILTKIMRIIMDMAKAIVEKVVSIHKTIKEQAKTYICEEGVEYDTTQGKMKEKVW